MIPKKFFGKTSREALRKVREALGADAIILSNRPVDEGIEILALAGEHMASLVSGPGLASTAAPQPAPRGKAEAQLQPANPGVAEPALAASVIDELKSMRGMLQEQLESLRWQGVQRHEPGKGQMLRDLLKAGFSPALVRQMLAKAPSASDIKQGRKWLREVLARNMRTVNGDDEVILRGGVYALMGPTGVGKTTTAAKLAARGVLRHGAGKVALLTTDSYRIGGHEQLRIYGKILGVTVHAMKDAADLQMTLADLRNKNLVLIDTVGMSQRDRMVAEQLAMLAGCGGLVKRLLLLNATCSGDTLEDVVQAYQGGAVYGCIVTKVDEAVGMGPVLDVMIRHRLALHYVANGQRVPEDIHLPNPQYLLHRAFRDNRDGGVYQLEDSEYPVLMAGMLGNMTGFEPAAAGGAHLG